MRDFVLLPQGQRRWARRFSAAGRRPACHGRRHPDLRFVFDVGTHTFMPSSPEEFTSMTGRSYPSPMSTPTRPSSSSGTRSSDFSFQRRGNGAAT